MLAMKGIFLQKTKLHEQRHGCTHMQETKEGRLRSPHYKLGLERDVPLERWKLYGGQIYYDRARLNDYPHVYSEM